MSSNLIFFFIHSWMMNIDGMESAQKHNRKLWRNSETKHCNWISCHISSKDCMQYDDCMCKVKERRRKKPHYTPTRRFYLYLTILTSMLIKMQPRSFVCFCFTVLFIVVFLCILFFLFNLVLFSLSNWALELLQHFYWTQQQENGTLWPIYRFVPNYMCSYVKNVLKTVGSNRTEWTMEQECESNNDD